MWFVMSYVVCLLQYVGKMQYVRTICVTCIMQYSMYIIVQYTICACRIDNIGCGTQSSILYVGYSLACIHVCVVCTMQYVYCSTYVRYSMQYVRTICCVTCIMQYSMYTIAQYTIYCTVCRMYRVYSMYGIQYTVTCSMQCSILYHVHYALYIVNNNMWFVGGSQGDRTADTGLSPYTPERSGV